MAMPGLALFHHSQLTLFWLHKLQHPEYFRAIKIAIQMLLSTQVFSFCLEINIEIVKKYIRWIMVLFRTSEIQDFNVCMLNRGSQKHWATLMSL